MGCIYTHVCAADEDDESIVLRETMDKPTRMPRLSRTATTLMTLDPTATKLKPLRRPTHKSETTDDLVFYGGGVPGVALDDATVDLAEYTGAIDGGYTSTSGKLRWGAHSRAGNDPMRRRKENQDSFCVADGFAGERNATFFSVFDGHGPEGAHVSHFVREAYAQAVASTYRDLVLRPKAAGMSRRASVGNDIMAEMFQKAAQSVTDQLTASGMDISVSGATAVGLLVCDRDLFVANIGDSRAIVAVYNEQDGKYVIRHETRDHKPELPDERQRIEAHNGRVFEWGSFRVWLQDVDMPGLAMSRSFGDSVAKSVGVTSEPDVVYVDRVVHGHASHPSFALLASDGVWEFMTTDECLAFVTECIVTSGMTPQETCNALVQEAYERWSDDEDVVDDITAIVVYF